MYVSRLRELRNQLYVEPDTVKRQEILDRMLFLIEANSRSRKADQQGEAEETDPGDDLEGQLPSRLPTLSRELPPPDSGSDPNDKG